jgi:hypothetical protein
VAQGWLQFGVAELVTVAEQPPRADPLVCPGKLAGALLAEQEPRAQAGHGQLQGAAHQREAG